MSDDTVCPLKIRWPNRGDDQCPRRITGFWIDSGYLTSSDEFEIGVYDENPARLRDLKWEPVELVVNGATQLIGRIEKTDRGDQGPNFVTLRGRDYLCDLVEGNVDFRLKITKDMTLVAALKLAMGPYGITEIISDADVSMQNVLTGINVKTRKKPKKSLDAYKLEELKPDFGQGCYDWCNKLVARHHLTIQPYTTRNTIRLADPTWDQDPIGKAWRTSGANPRGNIIQGRASEDGSRTPTVLFARCEKGSAGSSSLPLAINAGIDGVTAFRGMTSQVAITQPRLPGKCGPIEFGKLYRLMTYEDKVAKTEEQLVAGVYRALGERIKDLIVWTGTLRGYRDDTTGAIYSLDTLIDIADEWTDIKERMWIAQRRIGWGYGQGSSTNLTCWRIGALQL